MGFLADESRISPSAASQHLRKLRQGGLVRVRADGTRRLYRIDLDGLEPLRAWTDSFWDGILGSFAAYVEQQEVQR